jgi:hypothetical protein
MSCDNEGITPEAVEDLSIDKWLRKHLIGGL